ncbi:MAG: argininosuccinate lyase [Candidatus Omnitrophota bacterium]
MAKLWGGRFSKKTNPLAEEFTKSIQYDQKLAAYDLIGSLFHAEILGRSGFLSSNEVNRLVKALSAIFKRVIKGKFDPGQKDEDIHTRIQNELQNKLGNLALKLHTARSRNDQVVFATKLYSKKAILNLQLDVLKLTNSIIKLAHNNSLVIIPGFTHLQHAQPVYLKDYLWAYAEMLKRDEERLDYISKNMKITLGSGALAGTPIDSLKYTQKALESIKEYKGYTKGLNIKATENSLDSVSDRDFVIEILSALSIIGMHLSRLSEDLIIWSTKEFDFIRIDESFCTGSSLMPQKKNPDVLELIRGYTGRLYGNLVSVLTMMKGLPLTYNRDMQLDKEPLFNSFEIVSQELKVLEGIIKTLVFNKPKIEEQLKDESLYATDLVYYLVDKKIPFKEAHSIVGRLVKYSIDNSIPIKEMTDVLLKRFSGKFLKKEIIKLFDPVVSVKSKKSIRRRNS